MRSSTKIWRVYPNGHIKNQTHVLYPHRADGQQCTGYDGDVDAWSEHNKEWRGGCAQIVQKEGETPFVLYKGSVSADVLQSSLQTVCNLPTSIAGAIGYQEGA